MRERVLRVVERKTTNGIVAEIVETTYEFGTHYVLIINGHPGFHSVDLDRVENYMNDMIGV